MSVIINSTSFFSFFFWHLQSLRSFLVKCKDLFFQFSKKRRPKVSRRTFGTCNDGAALIGPFLDLAVLADGLGERADLEEAHEHRVVAGAVEAGLVRDDPVAFVVVLEHVITS